MWSSYTTNTIASKITVACNSALYFIHKWQKQYVIGVKIERNINNN